jgi:hypothetical protein
VERWKALQAGTIDAALQMIPYDDIATDAGFTNLGPAGGEFSFNEACVRLPAEQAVLAPFLAALLEASRWFRGHLEESAAIAAARTSIEPRYALAACQKLAADGVIPPDLRSAPGALAAAVGADRWLAEGTPVPSSHFALLKNRLDLTFLDTRYPYTLFLRSGGPKNCSRSTWPSSASRTCGSTPSPATGRPATASSLRWTRPRDRFNRLLGAHPSFGRAGRALLIRSASA